jgi:hypothetical protein
MIRENSFPGSAIVAYHVVKEKISINIFYCIQTSNLCHLKS